MLIGSPEWWDVVHDTPFFEAEQMIRHYRSVVLRKSGGPISPADQVTVNRCNDEIHRLSQLQSRANVAAAVRNLFGQEGWELVREEMARLELTARTGVGHNCPYRQLTE